MRQYNDNTPLALSGLGISWAMFGGLGFPKFHFARQAHLMGKCAQHLPMRRVKIKVDCYVEPMDLVFEPN